MRTYKYNFNLPIETSNGRKAGKFFFGICLLLLGIFVLMMVIRFTTYTPEPETKPIVKNLIIQKEISKKFIPKRDTLDKKLLCDLIFKLKKREGLRLEPYKLDGFWYIGYGHMITGSGDIVYPFDSLAAENLLINDINKAFHEYLRIHKKEVTTEVFNIYISGKPH